MAPTIRLWNNNPGLLYCRQITTQQADFPTPLWGCVETVLSVATAGRVRPVPYRTRKLSSPAPMVLHPVGCGRVGHRRHTNPRWWPTRSDPGGPHPHYRVRFVQALPVFRCGFACSNRTAGFLAANSSESCIALNNRQRDVRSPVPGFRFCCPIRRIGKPAGPSSSTVGSDEGNFASWSGRKVPLLPSNWWRWGVPRRVLTVLLNRGSSPPRCPRGQWW